MSDSAQSAASVMGKCFAEVGAALFRQLEDVKPAGVDSPWQQDGERFSEERRGSFPGDARHPADLIVAVLYARMFALADFLNGVALIAEHGRGRGGVVSSFSAAPIARAAMDALAWTYWLVEPDIGHHERVRRLLLDTVLDHQARARVVAPARIDGVDVPFDSEGLAEMCDVYGVQYKWGKPDPVTGVKLPHVLGERRPTAFDILTPLLRSKSHSQLGAPVYHLVTNIAHASTQGVLVHADVADGPKGEWQFRYARLPILRTVAPMLWAVPTPVLATFDYLGWDSDPFQEVFAGAAQELSAALSDT